jgi:hypothetical protein
MSIISSATQPFQYLGRKALRALEGGTIASMAVKGAGTDGANAVKRVLSEVAYDPIGYAGHLVDKTGNLVRYGVGQGFDAFKHSGQTVLTADQLDGVQRVAQNIPTHIKASASALSSLDGPTIKTFLLGEVARGQDLAEALNQNIPVKEIFNGNTLSTKTGNFFNGLKQGMPEVSIPNLHIQDGLSHAKGFVDGLSAPNLHIQDGINNVKGLLDGLSIPSLHIQDGLTGIRAGLSNFAPPAPPHVDLSALGHPLSAAAQFPGVETIATNIDKLLHLG